VPEIRAKQIPTNFATAPRAPVATSLSITDRLLLGCVSGDLLGFRHQRVINLDIGPHWRRSVARCIDEYYYTLLSATASATEHARVILAGLPAAYRSCVAPNELAFEPSATYIH
jgi:hypothetical protein